jgi:hypothetical protein
MRKAAYIFAVVLLAGCSAFGTGGIGDKYSKERSQFVSEEPALRNFPKGAVGVSAVPANSLSNDGPLANSATVGSETGFYVAADVTSDDLTDFYVDLLAAAGHQNIKLGCSDQSRFGSRRLTAAAWKERYGYVIAVEWYRQSIDRATKGYRPPVATDPYFVVIQLTSNKKMYPANDEDPVLRCDGYPLTRMAKALYPYGLTPMKVGPDYWSFHDPVGERFKQRKLPPHVTPRFTPTTTKA